jgi:hypothetical protein
MKTSPSRTDRSRPAPQVHDRDGHLRQHLTTVPRMTGTTASLESHTGGFVGVTAATILAPGRIHLHLSIPSSTYTRNTRIEVASPTSVAALERRLTERFGEEVEVFEASYDSSQP